MRIDFLHQNIYGVGGTVRSVINLANALSIDHDVRIVSLFRRVDVPTLRISPRVSLVPLIDVRAGGVDVGNALHNERSRVVPPAEELFNQYSRLTDARLSKYLESTDADVVVGTRPALNLAIATSNRNDFVRVVQEHTTITKLDTSVIARMREAYDRVDLVTTVSSADRDRVIEAVGVSASRVRVLPNGIPRPPVTASGAGNRIVVAAGRLSEQKRYDVLLRAFARVAGQHPDWRLRIYGDGPLGGALRKLALELGIGNVVDFMGATSNMDVEWAKGALSVCSSDYESFGMTIVESLRCGVPVVATDCPDGPREILTDGRDGLLVPMGDPVAMGDAICTLIGDRDRRLAMADAGFQTSMRYDPARVAETFLEMVAGVRRPIGRRLRSVLRRSVRPRQRRPEAPPTGETGERAGADAGVGVIVTAPDTLTLQGDPSVLSGAFWRNGAGLRVPLFPEGGAPSGTFDCSDLDEGIWNLHSARRGGSGTLRVRPLWIDSMTLLYERPATDRAIFSRAVPYTTLSGHVGLRVWRRERHAEVRAVSTDGASFRVELELMGAWGDSQALDVVARRPSGVGEIELGAGVFDGGRVSCEWPVQLFAERRVASQEIWNISLRGEGVLAPLACLSTDIPDLRKIRVLPSSVVDESAQDPASYVTGVSGVEVSTRFGRENTLQVCTVEV